MKTTDFIPQPQRRYHAHIMQVPVVNVCHVTAEDITLLDHEEVQAGPMMGHVLDGYLLDIDDLQEWQPSAYSDAFQHLIETFHNTGFSYLRLSGDADVLEDLPTFDHPHA